MRFLGKAAAAAAVLIAWAFCSVPRAAGQNTWVTFAGKVTDPTHAGIPHALIRIEGPDATQVHELKSDAEGSYSLSLLPPGSYTLRVSAAGFREYVREAIEGTAGARIELPVSLTIGDNSDTVRVSDRTDLIETENASRSSVLDAMQLKSLPILGRQIFNVLSLSPGVLFAQEEFGSNGYSGVRNWDIDGQYIINGGIPGTNQFLLNGAPISLTGRWQLSPSPDAVEEVQVLTNSYDAQYGRTGGGTVITSLRTGTNQWHGEAYEFLRNAVLDANTFDNNMNGIGRGKEIAHQFGGTVGGPLRSNRDFLFFSSDNYWEDSPQAIVSDTPPLDLRDGQHFAKYKILVYDPDTTAPCTNPATCLTPYSRTLFPGDVIPLSRISPIARAILNLYPAPNAPGVTQNFDASGTEAHFGYVQPIIRWDHNFSERDRLSAFSAYDHDTQSGSVTGFAGVAGAETNDVDRTSQHDSLDWTRVLSPTAIWDVRLSFGRFTQYQPQSACPSPCLQASDLGIQAPSSAFSMQSSAPRIDLGLYGSVLGSTFSWATENQIDFLPNFTLTRGRHTLHLGAEYSAAGIGQTPQSQTSGELNFNRGWTEKYAGVPRGYSDGSPIADLLLGLPSSGYLDTASSSYRHFPYYAGYLQDDWRLRRNVTINLGLRYDVQIPFTELNNRISDGFDFTAVSPYSDTIIANWKAAKAAWDPLHPGTPYPNPPAEILGGLQFPAKGNGRAFDTDWTDLQPRVGVAWNFLPKTVFRAGAGIFYRTETGFGSTYGSDQRVYYPNSFDGGFSSGMPSSVNGSLADPFQAAPAAGMPGLTTGVGDSIDFYSRDRPVPRTYEYSAGFQRELPGLLLLEADYAGSQTVHDGMAVSLNPGVSGLPVANTSQLAYLETLVPNPLANGGVPSSSELGGTSEVPIATLLRRFPQFENLIEDNVPVGRYRYDSLQLKLEKRVLDVAPAGVFSFAFAYTFSKSFAADHLLNPFDYASKPIHELAPGDRPQSVGFAGTWDLPFGWGRRYFSHANSFAAAFLNSWTMDWIYQYESGTPVDEPDAIFTCSSFKAPGGQTLQNWFNDSRACWSPRPVGSFRTTPDRFPNIRNPTAGQLNVSLEKTIWLNDRYFLQLRGEAYNLTNAPIFPAPSTDLDDPRFGALPLRQENFPRFVQISLRLSF